MNYTQDEQANTITDSQNYLHIPSSLIGFTNTHSSQHTAVSGKSVIQFHGVLKLDDTDRACPNCGGFMHINNTSSCSLWHLNFGHTYTSLEFGKNQLLCPTCGITSVQQVGHKVIGSRNHFCNTLGIFSPSEPTTSSKSLRLLVLARTQSKRST